MSKGDSQPQNSGGLHPFELLVACARTHLDQGNEARLVAVAQRVTCWDSIVTMAHKHGLLPLLYRHIHATCLDIVPRPVMDELAARARDLARRNLRMTAELIRLLGLLEEAGVAAVPFKGPSLAATVHGNLSLRQFADLDILVTETDLAKAQAVLVGEGYTANYDFSPAVSRSVQRYAHESLFWRDDGMIVELQWQFAAPFLRYSLAPDDIRRRLVTVPLGGRLVPAFAPDDLLDYLCFHGGLHTWGRLGWVCDVAELLRTYPRLDAEAVLQRARSAGRFRSVALGLLLAGELLDAPLPAGLLRRLQAQQALRSLADQVHARLSHPERREAGIFWVTRFHMRLRDTALQRARMGLMLLTAPQEADLLSLPITPRFRALYAVVRPSRLLVKWLTGKYRAPAADGEIMPVP